MFLNSSTPLMISRIHATIKTTSEGGALLVSQGVNGVIVNGIVVQKQHLQVGDIIVFGGAGAGTKVGVSVKNPQSELRYEFVAAPTPKPAPSSAPTPAIELIRECAYFHHYSEKLYFLLPFIIMVILLQRTSLHI